MKFKNKNILVFGLGKSGNACVKQILKQDGSVFVYDDNKEILKNYKKHNINIFSMSDLDFIDIVILSPGVPKDNETLIKIKEKNIQIISELEFAYLNLKSSNIVAITGTNGKTTTTELINEILGSEIKTFKCGNIGIPLTSRIDNIIKNDCVVIEVSSFQLEDCLRFKPYISVITNLSNDHLDRYLSVEEYWRTKLKVCENQNENDYLVLNENLKQFKIESKAKKIYFSTNNEVLGVFRKDNKIYYKFEENEVPIFLLEEKDISLKGIHNLENALAAICVALIQGISVEKIRFILKNFSAIEHRFEKITTIKGVEFVNDSKATNIDATLKAVEGLNCDIHLLLGGSDKGENFDLLFKKLPKNVFVYLFGSTTNKMIHSCLNVGFRKFKICTNMKTALEKAYLNARRGDLVLLSPACASFDAFKNFEERGKYFKEWVFALNEK